LRLDPLGHVNAASDITSELPVLTEVGAAPVENPAVLAVVTLQAVVHLEHFTPGKCAQVRLQAKLQIVRVHAFSPAVPHLLVHGPSAELKPAIVEVVALGREIRAPDQNGRLLYKDFVLVSGEPIRLHGWKFIEPERSARSRLRPILYPVAQHGGSTRADYRPHERAPVSAFRGSLVGV